MRPIRLMFAMCALLASLGCGENVDEMPAYGGVAGSGGSGTGATIVITPSTLPDGTVSAAYSQTLAATGGTAPYTWSRIAGALPTGLTLGATTGIISGTPTGTGTYSFTVQARDASLSTGSQVFSIAVYTVPTITTATIPAAVQGTAYSTLLSATGGQTPYSWSLASGTMPAGITLNANGTITGTTAAGAGDYIIEVVVTDAGARTSASQFLTLTVNAGITLSPATLPTGTAGTAYSQTLTASGGTADYSCAVTNGTLPTSLSLATVVPDTCTVTGTPSVAGTFNFQVTATDFWGAAGAQTYSVTINLGFTSTTLPGASVAAGPYSLNLNTPLLGETGATAWSVTGGALPPTGSWALSAAGVLSGTPDAADVAGSPYTFDVLVTDSAAIPNTATFTLSVSIAP